MPTEFFSSPMFNRPSFRYMEDTFKEWAGYSLLHWGRDHTMITLKQANHCSNQIEISITRRIFLYDKSEETRMLNTRIEINSLLIMLTFTFICSSRKWLNRWFIGGKRLDCFSSPVRTDDLLAVSDSSHWVFHVETHPHGLVHHVEHVDVGIIEDGSHLLQALLTHLQ